MWLITEVYYISVLYRNHRKRAAKTLIHHNDIPSINKTVTTLTNAAVLEPWNLAALALHVCYLVIRRGY
jgi:hypothetical protein